MTMDKYTRYRWHGGVLYLGWERENRNKLLLCQMVISAGDSYHSAGKKFNILCKIYKIYLKREKP